MTTKPSHPGFFFNARHREFTPEMKAENAHQGEALLHLDPDCKEPLAFSKFTQVGGKTHSFVSVTDFDRVCKTISHAAAAFDTNFKAVPTLAFGVKHGNACCASFDLDGNRTNTLERMLDCNLTSIFGGVIMTNFPIDENGAEILLHYRKAGNSKRRLLAGVAAPKFTECAVKLFKEPEDSICLLANPNLASLNKETLPQQSIVRPLLGGYMLQNAPSFIPDLTDEELFCGGGAEDILADLLLAFAVCANSNSNTITMVNNSMLIGNGVSQQSRVDAAKLAVNLAQSRGHNIQGASAWSDSYFPFPDGPAVLLDAGVENVFATTGSIKDGLVRELFKERGKRLFTRPDAEARCFAQH